MSENIPRAYSYNQEPDRGQIEQVRDGLDIALRHGRGAAFAYIDTQLPMREAAELLGQQHHFRVEDTTQLVQSRYQRFRENEQGTIVIGYDLEADCRNGYQLQTIMRARHNMSKEGTKILVLTQTLPDAILTEDSTAPFWNGPIPQNELWQLESVEDGIRIRRTTVDLVDGTYTWRDNPGFDIVLGGHA